MYWRARHSGVKGDTFIETRPANPKANEWAERIAAQQRSGISVKQFCKEQFHVGEGSLQVRRQPIDHFRTPPFALLSIEDIAANLPVQQDQFPV
jgi:hypothetical protein